MKALHKGLTRRSFLTGLGLTPWFPALLNAAMVEPKSAEIFVNGHHDQVGNFAVSGLNPQGTEQFRLPLPEMPHGFGINPKQNSQIAIFPGLTGKKATVINVKTGQQQAEITTRPNRHFNGHGAFSLDGKLLFATENIIDTSEGVIGVYNAQTFEFIREIPAYGLGPHGMRIMPDGKTIVVANGGLRTHPETGKFYTNLNDMQSAVVFIDIATGKLIARRKIGVPRLSIRNIYLAPDNQLVVTCQYYGKRAMPKLVGLIQHMGEIEMMAIDEDNLWSMNNYTGGTVIVGHTAAVSCPRGNRLTFWDLQKKRFLKSVEIKDVSGIQPYGDGQQFIASAETGKLYQIDLKTAKAIPLSKPWSQAKWTNHMIKALV